MNEMTPLVTIEDFEALGDDAPFELIRGVLYETTPSNFGQSMVAGRFATEFARFREAGHLLVGGGGFLLERDPDSLVVPDVVFVRDHRAPSRSDWQDWAKFAPDIVVEVRRPTYFVRKLAVLLDAGLLLVWVADTDEKLVVAHTRGGVIRVYSREDTLDGGDVLPGFAVAVETLFR